MSELLLDTDISQTQFEQEFAFSSVDYGAVVVAHEVSLNGKDTDESDKEDSSSDNKENPVLEPDPSKSEDADQ